MHPTKCPCCNNPWASGEFFAKLCQTCDDETKQEERGISRGNMDFDVPPSRDFYHYANGNWMKQNPIPSDYPNWNSFVALHVASQENLKVILQGLSASDNDDDEARKLAAFYQAAMDEDAIEKAGVAPLQKVLALADEIVDSKDDKTKFATLLGTMNRTYGIAPFWNISVGPDNSNTDISIAQISQGGLGLPDRDYYFDDDKEETRAAYKAYVAKLLALLQNGGAALSADVDDTMVAAADSVYALEMSLAEAHMTKTENRDPHATYNKMSIPEFTATTGDVDFAAYLAAATGKTVESLGDINIRNKAALQKATEVASSTSADVLAWYLKRCILNSCASYLTEAFVMARFDFYEKTLMGTQQIKPRWKRAMAFTESVLGEALGKLFCAKYFDEDSKDRALKIVEQVRQALEDRLKEVDWIKADSTRAEALKKMAKFGVKIGYPDEWIDYSTLDINSSDSFLEMIFKAREFDNLLDIKEMNAPTNRKKWFLTPQTVNAYYHPNLNEIVFPAAILQHPFFDKDADDAVNFGSMGAVIGHEMTHGFDDKGRKFNYAGTLTDWWTEDDSKEYESRVGVMVEQADSYEVHGQNVRGQLTSGENIADLGGLRLAMRALQVTEGYDETKLIDGFTPMQRFFLSWAQCWRQNVTKERSLQLLTIDPHGPNAMRCNGPLSNMPEFHGAFEVGEKDPMFRAEEKRVNIW